MDVVEQPGEAADAAGGGAAFAAGGGKLLLLLGIVGDAEGTVFQREGAAGLAVLLRVAAAGGFRFRITTEARSNGGTRSYLTGIDRMDRMGWIYGDGFVIRDP
jgi:hypothetical protein